MARKPQSGEESQEPAREPGARSGHPERRRVVRLSEELLSAWQRAVLSNDGRVEILVTICEERTTPKMIADALGKSLREVKYHVGILHRRNLIEEDPAGQCVDAEDRFYRAIASVA